MAIDAQKRLEDWNDKFDTEHVKRVLDRKRATMLARVQVAFAELCSMEEQVREVLNGASVQTVLYVPYLDYGRQLWKLTRRQNITGPSFALAAEILLRKWANRGLDPAILARIRHEVFNIEAP